MKACSVCGVAIASWRRAGSLGVKVGIGGLCSAHYRRRTRYGDPTFKPVYTPRTGKRRSQVPNAVVVEEWEFLGPMGVSRDEAARRLGMSRAAFDKALERAAQREKVAA